MNRDIVKNPTLCEAKNSKLRVPSHLVTWIPHTGVGGGVGMWLLVQFIDLFSYHNVDKSRTGSKVIKLYSCSTQLSMIFSANKYKIANNSWHFHIY